MTTVSPITLLERLCSAPITDAPTTVVIVAHPDDETIGAGARLPHLHEATFIHVTDGAPRNLHDAHKAGFETRQGYARARRDEVRAALTLAGVAPGQMRTFDVVDQEAGYQLVPLTRATAATLCELRPEVVLTHPYEGGHPDHDATAFAVHMACRQLRARGLPAPVIVEMTSYHNRGGRLTTFEFLPAPERRVITHRLASAQRAFKERLMACFRTQRHVLEGFPTEIERFRVAPSYRFDQRPHTGRLWYEMFDWGMTAERWSELARAALRELAFES